MRGLVEQHEPDLADPRVGMADGADGDRSGLLERIAERTC